MSSITPIFALNQDVFVNQDMSGDLQSPVLDLGELTGYAVHATWDGDPDGMLTVYGSNTMNPADFVPVNTQSTGGEAGAHLLNVEKAHYKYVMVDFTAGSGNGNLNCKVSGKRV